MHAPVAVSAKTPIRFRDINCPGSNSSGVREIIVGESILKDIRKVVRHGFCLGDQF
jgi:hypothetical protein